MTRKADNFDGIAPWYDLLVKAVFGKSIKRAQELYLNKFPEKGQILILGGGTGWIVKSLLNVRPLQHVTFIEASPEMLKIAEERLSGVSDGITFVLGTEQTIPAGILYDGIVTNFFLDLFPQKELDALIIPLKKHLKTNCYWIVTDFAGEKWWHRAFLKTMYIFFKIASNIRAKRLPMWNKAMMANGFQEITSASFYGGFIVTKLYRVSD